MFQFIFTTVKPFLQEVVTGGDLSGGRVDVIDEGGVGAAVVVVPVFIVGTSLSGPLLFKCERPEAVVPAPAASPIVWTSTPSGEVIAVPH